MDALAQGGFAQVLTAWVGQIVIVLVLAGAAELILPDTEMKRFGRMAMGFFVVLAVAQPLLAVVGADLDPAKALSLAGWDLGYGSGSLTGMARKALDKGTSLGEASRDRVLAAARTALETQVVSLAKREAGVAEAKAEVILESDPSSAAYGSLVSVRLVVWLGPTEAAGSAAPGAGTGSAEPGAVGAGTGEVGGGAGAASEPVSPVTIEVNPIVVVAGKAGTGPGAAAPGGGSRGRGGADEGTAVIDSGQNLGALAYTPAGQLARRLRSELVLLLGVPNGGLAVEVWPYEP